MYRATPPLTCHFTFLIWRSRVRSPAAAKFIRINLIRNSNLSSFQICHTRNLFRQQNCSYHNFPLYCFWPSDFDLFCSSTLQLILTLALPVKLRKRTSCPLWSASMASSGEQSPAVVHTYQGLPPAVRRTRRWTLHYDAEMFNRCQPVLSWPVNALRSKIQKRGRGWPIF